MYVCRKKKAVLFIYLFKKRGYVSVWLLTLEKNAEVEEKAVFIIIKFS